MSDNTISKYDRLYGSMRDVSVTTKPSTVKLVQSLTGESETYVIQTMRHEEGDYIFLECMDKTGVTRLALPPKVAAIIASQRDALTKRKRSAASKATMRARMDAGEVIGFKKKG